MAVNTQKLRLSSLDVNQLKQSFITYLQSTSEFQNFNFNASGIASLLDLLSYNTYYQSIMANFLVNETFLNTATKRENVVSRANELGYTPASKTASSASLQITVTNVTGDPTTLVLPAGTTFTTSVGSSTFNFMTLVPYSANVQVDSQGNPFYQFTISVYEGLLTQNTFTLQSDLSIDILNMDIDTSTLRVYVTYNSITQEFYPPGNFLTIQPTDRVFFITEGFNAYKITFGDNTFGVQPTINSSVQCTYLVTSGDVANGAQIFSFASSISGSPQANVTVSTISGSAGGTAVETINSIKTNASNYFSTQNRAVTSTDFAALIKESSTNVKDVLTWGGETNNPPYFGKIVACVEPNYGDSLTTNDKSNIRTIIKGKSIPVMDIVFVDPTYLYLVVNSTITYDSSIITLSTYDLQVLVQNTIASYVSTNLSMFNGKLRFSNLSTSIDDADPSIVSNITKLSLKYEYIPTLYQNTSLTFSFNNEIDNTNKSYSLKSTLFNVAGNSNLVWIEDDTNGNLNLFFSKGGVKTYAAYNIGTINYLTGAVYISGLNVTAYQGMSIDFVVVPASTDLVSYNTTIILANSNDITVSTQVSS